jgi:hypothetical protein
MDARGGAIPPSSALSDIEIPFNTIVATVPLIRRQGRQVKANLSLDSGILAAIDAAASARGVSRSILVETLARQALHDLA